MRRISTPRNQPREKVSSRGAPCDKKVTKDVTLKSTVPAAPEPKRQEDASTTTLSRLQDKIARKMVIGKHQRKTASKVGNEIPIRRHSVNVSSISVSNL